MIFFFAHVLLQRSTYVENVLLYLHCWVSPAEWEKWSALMLPDVGPLQAHLLRLINWNRTTREALAAGTNEALQRKTNNSMEDTVTYSGRGWTFFPEGDIFILSSTMSWRWFFYRLKELTSKNFSCLEWSPQVLAQEESHGCCRLRATKLLFTSITFQRFLTSSECRGHWGSLKSMSCLRRLELCDIIHLLLLS